jgi:hypothetical protein
MGADRRCRRGHDLGRFAVQFGVLRKAGKAARSIPDLAEMVAVDGLNSHCVGFGPEPWGLDPGNCCANWGGIFDRSVCGLNGALDCAVGVAVGVVVVLAALSLWLQPASKPAAIATANHVRVWMNFIVTSSKVRASAAPSRARLTECGRTRPRLPMRFRLRKTRRMDCNHPPRFSNRLISITAA